MTNIERITLKRAGFTDRQISDHRAKFENLLRINPCLTSELEELHRLQGFVAKAFQAHPNLDLDVEAIK